MVYCAELAERLRTRLGKMPGVSEKAMFGGIALFLNGNMVCGVHKDDLILRLGKEAYDKGLRQPYTQPFDMTGRPMSGWLMVAPEGCAEDQSLDEWVAQALDYVKTLPAK
jgi:TfoX/Sxy family transcriptional regulator of competence genes